ncbi:sigma-E factor negative regulatory protein [Sulfuricystis thermophila]|uniref:sigma-E factor negative regulatory protein n=1 Tax=Sulfuricystis thermophila TaxID=2496847 RepID=UPI001559703D|nr:RseA family anti-sigma factor [Sulfuricystis thermophila]
MDIQRAMKISALVDGEVEEHEVREAIQSSLDDPHRWRDYLLIGESLRGESAPLANITEAVMARLADEPIVLAPRKLRERRPRPHPLWALAASVAGVAVVGWVAMTGDSLPTGSTAKLVAAPQAAVTVASAEGGAVPPAPTFRSESAPGGTILNPPAPTFRSESAPPSGASMIPPTATLVNAVPAAAAEMQEYLLAHQAQAATVRLAEPARQIRTVALTATHP